MSFDYINYFEQNKTKCWVAKIVNHEKGCYQKTMLLIVDKAYDYWSALRYAQYIISSMEDMKKVTITTVYEDKVPQLLINLCNSYLQED